ncbi:MAG: flagellar hook-length control protein FliK [Proteobacteria bacterium]|nr:flagellar hook-length control protein FliK [Pseudomonadota bacterium]
MPGMTTMPIFQSAQSANSSAKSLHGTVAPTNIPDAQDTPNIATDSGAANAATTSSSDTTSNAEAGAVVNSFADELKRQLVQTNPGGTPVPDFSPVPDPTLPIQPVSGMVAVLSSHPVTVETLLSDLSNFVHRLSIHGSSPKPLSTGSEAVAADIQNSPAAAVSDVVIHSSPVAIPEAVGIRMADPAPQLASPKKEDDAPREMPPDGLAALASLIQSIQPNEVSKPAAGVPVADKKPVFTNNGGLLLTPALPTPVMANLDMGTENTPATPADFLTQPASKSAEFAAAKATLTEVMLPKTGHGESIEPEKSFDALLVTAQTLSQHRNGDVHASSVPSTPLPVHTPVGTHGWDGEVGDKLVWMVGRQEQRAELVLNPPQMGRIEVSLSMSDGQTSAQFVSANPAVRDALEAALPRLREILADAGINLGQTQVGADTGNNAGNSSTNNAENRDNSGRGSSKDPLSPGNEVLRQLDAPQWVKRGNGLVDVFA